MKQKPSEEAMRLLDHLVTSTGSKAGDVVCVEVRPGEWTIGRITAKGMKALGDFRRNRKSA